MSTTTTVTLPTNRRSVMLDPGTCRSAYVENTGNVTVCTTWATEWNGAFGSMDSVVLGPGEHRWIYPAGPVTAYTAEGSTGQVTVTVEPR